jgi:hypothetical protein
MAMLGLAGITTIAPAASASESDCPDSYVCMWEDPYESGSLYVYQPGNAGSYEIDWWDGDNEISSVVNRTGKCIILYDGDDQTGSSYTINATTTRLYNLSLNGWDNRAESYNIVSSC